VRATLATDDGALIFIRYNGRVDFSNPEAPGPAYTTPRFETGDERDAWRNTIQAVMNGRSDGRTPIAYRLCELR